jgi:serine/threonine-protein kinase RsbW
MSQFSQQVEFFPIQNEWQLPSRLDCIPDLQEEIVSLLQRAGFGEQDIFAVRLALEEAVANAMKHGNRLCDDKTVRVWLCLQPEAVTLRVSDEGEGFDPDSVPDPRAEENLERPCGRGLLLMRYFMHQVEFLDRGSTVVMVRRRESDPAGESCCAAQAEHSA